MEIIIISGRSGAGKSVALRALEDTGYYCVDNIPLDLLPQLTDILSQSQSSVAISLDIRNILNPANSLEQTLSTLKNIIRLKSFS